VGDGVLSRGRPPAEKIWASDMPGRVNRRAPERRTKIGAQYG
jgi:hypothetical protein